MASFNWTSIFTQTDLDKKVSDLEKKNKEYESMIQSLKSRLEVAHRDVVEKSEDIMDLKVENLKLEKRIKKIQKDEVGWCMTAFLVGLVSMIFVIIALNARC